MSEYTGTVRWFNEDKGYGFLGQDHDEKDMFVHVSELEKAGIGTLREGQRVKFKIAMGTKGKPHAIDLKLLNA